MLQKGLSNRPSGAVALLILTGSLVLNWVRGEDVLAERFWNSNLPNWNTLTCFAEQAAGHLHKVLEEVVIGSSSDYSYQKQGRKAVEINLPGFPFEKNTKPPARFQEINSPRCMPAPTTQTACLAPA